MKEGFDLLHDHSLVGGAAQPSQDILRTAPVQAKPLFEDENRPATRPLAPNPRTVVAYSTQASNVVLSSLPATSTGATTPGVGQSQPKSAMAQLTTSSPGTQGGSTIFDSSATSAAASIGINPEGALNVPGPGPIQLPGSTAFPTSSGAGPSGAATSSGGQDVTPGASASASIPSPGGLASTPTKRSRQDNTVVIDNCTILFAETKHLIFYVIFNPE